MSNPLITELLGVRPLPNQKPFILLDKEESVKGNELLEWKALHSRYDKKQWYVRRNQAWDEIKRLKNKLTVSKYVKNGFLVLDLGFLEEKNSVWYKKISRNNYLLLVEFKRYKHKIPLHIQQIAMEHEKEFSSLEVLYLADKREVTSNMITTCPLLLGVQHFLSSSVLLGNWGGDLDDIDKALTGKNGVNYD